MIINLMDIKRQHEQHASEYEEAALNVLRSGCYIGGNEVSAFEEEFANYEGAKFGISCGNGTDALQIALRALNIGPGDEVITVSFTFFATAESIAAVGATPVFVDVCEDTYCINTNLVENLITDKTKAILPVHFYGQACDMDALKFICKKHNLFLITDCAQATGTKYKGERKNILGDISCFSFFPTKNLGCDGDGGMILTDNEEIARACRALKVHGSGKNGLVTLKREYEIKNMSMPSSMPVGESKYYNYLIGYNSRLDAIQAAILRKKLKYIDEFIEGRRFNAQYYKNHLKGTEYILPFEADYGENSYYIFALQHPNCEKIKEKLIEKGVGTGTYYPVALHLQGAFKYLGYKEGDLPITERLCKTTFAVPVFPELTQEEREYVVETLLWALEDK